MWRRDDDLQRMLRESFDAFAVADHSMARVRRCRTLDSGFESDVWAKFGKLGWAGILLPEDVGGAGLTLGSAAPIAEGIGRQLLPEPFVATAIIAATVIARSETSLAKAIASGLASGQRVATLAWQETLNQTAYAPIGTRLDRKGSGFSLNGTKLFVPAWSAGTTIIVSCNSGDKTHLVVVEPDVQGVAVTPRKMSDGTLTADLVFNDLEVSDDDILLSGQEAADSLELALVRGKIALCAQLEGLASEVFRKTVDYMNQRIQFGQALSDFQALRHRMVDLHAEIELSGASWRMAAGRLETEGALAARVSVSAAKARCSQTALDVAKAALQYHGAFGYTEDADVGLYLNAALRLSSWLGNPLAHRRNAYRLHAELSNHA